MNPADFAIGFVLGGIAGWVAHGIIWLRASILGVKKDNDSRVFVATAHPKLRLDHGGKVYEESSIAGTVWHDVETGGRPGATAETLLTAHAWKYRSKQAA